MFPFSLMSIPYLFFLSQIGKYMSLVDKSIGNLNFRLCLISLKKYQKGLDQLIEKGLLL